MKITLKQYGGLAPVTRPPVVLDTADLDQDRDEVEGLARAVSAQSSPPAPPHPDGMSYTLVIDGDEGMQEVRGTDGSATAEFSELVQRVRGSGKAGGA
ncbi:protealysin inhibitor emfourin [Massilia niabensis]|uniref:Protealysin inhibitor emfourin n=1 Tax=Massilia niabensis TaxID=544910 RepID=A0ABW0L967_9BURK